jgi:hypothetical protein
MADREPVDLEDVLTPEQLEELNQAIRDDNVEAFRTFFESKEFPLLPEDQLEEVPLTFYVLGANRDSNLSIYRPNIFKYLLDHGANVDFLSSKTRASSMSEVYFLELDDDFEIDTWTSLAANAAVLGNLDALKLLYEYGADFSLLPEKEAADGWESIPGETIQYFVEKKLIALDRSIESYNGVVSRLEKTVAAKPNNNSAKQYLAQYKKTLEANIQERIKIARVLRWIRYITTEENIPAYRTTARNRKAYANVLLRAPGLGRLEKNYLMSFVPKPVKFAVVPEHGLKRINTSLFQEPPENGLKRVNTSLFQGGKTRRRRARKMRSRRRRN